MKKMLFGFVALAAMLFITSCDTAGGSEKPGYRGDMGLMYLPQNGLLHLLKKERL